MPVESLLKGESGEWTFDASVADAFDDMLERSIPQYAIMRELVFDVGVQFVKPHTEVLDLGCSRGEALVPFIKKFTAFNRDVRFVGIDVSEPMLDAARKQFASYPKTIVSIESFDLRTGFPPVNASLILSVLTLMFTPINYRTRIVEDVYKHLTPSGAFILVEKLVGQNSQSDNIIQSRYHRMKAENGYSREEIVRKQAALEGVQVPVTATWNEELLRNAGFRYIECFWRWMNFAAWVAIKGN